MKKAERNTIQKQAKEFVKRYIDSHEPDTFVYNEHGIMLYKAGYSTINLESFFEDIIEDFISELPDTSQQLAEREREIKAYKLYLKDWETKYIEQENELSRSEMKQEQLESTIQSLKEEVEGKEKSISIIAKWSDEWQDKFKQAQSTITTQAEEIKKLREGNNELLDTLIKSVGWLESVIEWTDLTKLQKEILKERKNKYDTIIVNAQSLLTPKEEESKGDNNPEETNHLS